MKSRRTSILILASIATLSGSAQAAVVTRTFAVTALGNSGDPVVGPVGFTFGITYDDNSDVTNEVVDFYTTTSNYASLNVTPVTFTRRSEQFYIAGYTLGLDFFRPDFSVDFNGGNIPATGSTAGIIRYTVGDGTSPYSPSNLRLFETTGVAPAVPEPASWAMLIAGLGMAGGAMRRRQRVSVRFA